MTAQFPSSATVAGDGTASIKFGPTVTSVKWLVSQVAVQLSTAVSGATAQVTFNGQLITATSTGSLDSADGYPYLTVRPDDALVVSWANAIPGTIAFATIYYDEEPA